MKKILLALFCILCSISPFLLKAQTFNLATLDTVYGTVITTGGPVSGIVNTTGSNIGIKWHVINSDFPASWRTGGALGICDNSTCRYNAFNVLWDSSSATGSTFICTYFSNSAHDDTGHLYLSLDLSSAVVGTHWLTVSMTDTLSSTTKRVTFVVNRAPSAVANLPGTISDITLYPNPANSELNIVYDVNADVKNVVVYSIIGKVTAVYKVTDNTSANLNLENIPSGIYFVRLVNSHGAMVATRKFTKQ
jgi:hypothetical protein